MKSTIEQASEERVLEVLVDQAPVGVCIIQDRKFCYANYYFLDAIGYSLAELMAKDSFEIVAPEDREMVRKNTIDMLKGEIFSPYQFRVICNDGSIIWVIATVKSIQYHGKPAVLGNYMEITGRKQVEEKLRLLSSVTQHVSDAIMVADPNFKTIYVNEAAQHLFGYSIEQMLGKHLDYFNAGLVPIELDQEIQHTICSGKVWGGLLPKKRKNGSTFLGECHITPILGEDGSISSYIDVLRDVTERNRVEEALRKSEEKYKELANSITDVFFAMDGYLRYTYWNKASELLTGIRAEDAIGKSLFEIFPDSPGRRKAEKVYRAVLNNQKSQHFANSFDIDGKQHLLDITAYPSQGGISVLVRDITDSREAEEKVRHSEERYRTILEEMEDAYFEVDLGGHFTFVNNAACRDLGYSSKELIGMSYKKITSEEDIDPIFRVFNEVYQTGVSNKGFPWTTIRKDGSHGFAETSVSPILDDKGNIDGFRGFGHDITEHRRIEEALQQSEENYRILFDSSVIGTIVLEAETLKIAMANRAATEIFGFSSVEEVRGANPFDFIRPEDKEKVLNLASTELFEKDSRQVYELGAFTRDGREIWISATGARITHEGKLAGLISFTDITDRKQQNERLLMTDRLASLGELASGAAHELNNPLTSIIGFSQLLIEKDVPDDIREELKLINNEARRAVLVTNNFLSFARKHSSTKELNQINNIIEDVLELRAYEHRVNHIDIERHIDTDLPEIMVDYFQMQQVFMNIIINAEHFMVKTHNKGTLTITTEKENGTVRVLFADDGPGITSENLGRIFDPFFTTKEAGSGTGLGLSICHGIVTEHGGQIFATSQLGKGATIVVELPIKKRARIESLA